MQIKNNFKASLSLTMDRGRHAMYSDMNISTRKQGAIYAGPMWNPVGISNANDHNTRTELLAENLYNKYYGEIQVELDDIVELINIGDRRAKARIVELIKELKWKNDD